MLGTVRYPLFGAMRTAEWSLLAAMWRSRVMVGVLERLLTNWRAPVSAGRSSSGDDYRRGAVGYGMSMPAERSRASTNAVIRAKAGRSSAPW